MKLNVAVPELVNYPLPITCTPLHGETEASQKFTCPAVSGEPAVTAAVNVTSVPAATDVTVLPDDVTDSVVPLDPGDADELPTVTSKGALDESEPAVPLIIAVAVTGDASALAVNVTVLEPGVIGFEEKVAVTPLGKPVADKLTLPPNAFCGVTTTVDLAELPG